MFFFYNFKYVCILNDKATSISLRSRQSQSSFPQIYVNMLVNINKGREKADIFFFKSKNPFVLVIVTCYIN